MTVRERVAGVLGSSPALKFVLVVGVTLAAPTRAAHYGAVRDTPSPAMIDRMRVKFPTAAIAILEVSEDWAQLAPGTAGLTYFVRPRDLAADGT